MFFKKLCPLISKRSDSELLVSLDAFEVRPTSARPGSVRQEGEDVSGGNLRRISATRSQGTQRNSLHHADHVMIMQFRWGEQIPSKRIFGPVRIAQKTQSLGLQREE